MKFKAEEEIRKVVDPIAEEQGLKVCSVEFKNTDDPSITVFIDKEGGVDLDACERFHNAIDAPLDELDPSFGESFTLTCTSLGADRPFVTEEDFRNHLNTKVEVRLNTSVKGKKFFEGELVYFDEKTIRVKVSQKDTLTFDRKSVRKVSEAIEF